MPGTHPQYPQLTGHSYCILCSGIVFLYVISGTYKENKQNCIGFLLGKHNIESSGQKITSLNSIAVNSIGEIVKPKCINLSRYFCLEDTKQQLTFLSGGSRRYCSLHFDIFWKLMTIHFLEVNDHSLNQVFL